MSALRQRTVQNSLLQGTALYLGAVCLSLPLFGACRPKGASSAPSATPPVQDSTPPPGGNLIKNAHFPTAASIPWTTSFTSPAKGRAQVESGALCITIESAGVQPWDAQLRHREMTAVEGHSYTASFRIWANQVGMARLKLGMSGPPYAEYWFQDIPLSTEPKQVRATLVMRGKTDPTAEFAFHLGGRLAREAKFPLKICIDDVFLSDPEYTPPPVLGEVPVSPLRVNQLGYFPEGEKLATWVTAIATPSDWALHSQDGKVVAQGKTAPLGVDASSGDAVQSVDFSQARVTGKGFWLEIEGQKSAPFSILPKLYSELTEDALSYFYHNRSGTPIEMPYARDPKWARPAGHAISDASVPCAPGIGCTYKLNVSGGWYDAGDHGKYVVNGGISVWTLLNAYERALSRGSEATFADGTLNIPEHKNRVPDILDEARYELEFLLKMQVPPGAPHAGMVHHKIHDKEWTALGIRPDQAEKSVERALRPVSTAATLNLAAVAAQAARLYGNFDAAFAKRALDAAEVAYAAALREPNLLASPSDGQGGGSYEDSNITDEFFWAASELWLTTGKPAYLEAAEKSPHFAQMTGAGPGATSAMTWRQTEALGKLSWIYAKASSLRKPERETQAAQITALAAKYVEVALHEGYRVPHAPDAEGKYYWGSNSDVLNNSLILAAAYDLTRKQEFLTAAAWGMDYLLGRNALDQSFVTGYGSRPLRNPHHRFWAHQADANFPEAPPGAISGGPNSELQDPYGQAAGLPGCKAQKCFIDHVEAYSLNEIAINWNAPLVWLTSFLDQSER